MHIHMVGSRLLVANLIISRIQMSRLTMFMTMYIYIYAYMYSCIFKPPKNGEIALQTPRTEFLRFG